MTCAPAWGAACTAWWCDASDDRLRRRVLDTLGIAASELDRWLAVPLDEPGLIRVHRHVVARRAAVERGETRRVLATGMLRSGPVVSYPRSGVLAVFPDAGEVAQHVGALRAQLAALPEHPFLRAAWIAHAIGAIHPFGDANGGTARFCASLELARSSLPPLAITALQRNTSYINAMVGQDLAGLQRVVYDTVQQELASALLEDHVARAAWSTPTRARADRWIAAVDRAWRGVLGAPPSVDEPGAAGLVRLAQRGYCVPRLPAPRCMRWALASPVPLQLELAIAPVRGGAATWMLAVVGASVGDAGRLAPLVHREAIAPRFVAAADEDEPTVDARFERWIADRLDTCLRGLASWM